MRKIVVAAFLMSVCMFCSSEAGVDPFVLEGLNEGLIFHAGFEDTTEADYAAGNPEPAKVEGVLNFVEGKQGRAIVSGRDGARLSYFNEGNFEILQGSIAMWVQPIDWQGKREIERAADKYFRLFSQGTARDGYFGLQMARWHQPLPRLGFFCQNYPDKGRASISASVTEGWENGSWHHIVLTWDNKGTFTMFVDGEQLSSSSLDAPFSEENLYSETFYIGNNNSIEHTAFDEFKIWNRCLKPQEARTLYFQQNNL